MSDATPRKIEPEHLGLLGDRPLAEIAGGGSPDDLFPGATRFLGARKQKQRRDLWTVVAPHLDRLLLRDEHVLHVAPAHQVPPGLQAMAFGALQYHYYQVLLVVTESRLIEVLLDGRGRKPATRVRSWAWAHTSDLKQFMRRLTIVPAKGKKQAWNLRLGGDRKLLALLLPRLKARLLREGSAAADAAPVWHCPRCAAACPPEPERCAGCGQIFRSKRLATWLSIAFPGAGLLYAGHPVLAAGDFLGEIMLFGILGAAAVGADAAGAAGLLILGVLFFAGTKIESIHLGRILAARCRPDTPERAARFRRFGLAGAGLSAAAIVALVMMTGRMPETIDHDLDVVAEEAWTGSRDPEEWEAFNESDTKRSEWISEDDGRIVTVFAYTLGPLDDVSRYFTDVREAMKQKGAVLVSESDQLPSGFQGSRSIWEIKEGDDRFMTVNVFIRDPQGNDIHHVHASSVPGEEKQTEEQVLDLLRHARWIDAAASPRPLAAATAPR